MEKAIARITAGILIAIGTLDIFPIISAKAIPVIVPMIPPKLVSTAASVKNWARILFFLAPIAFLRPISLVRSVTSLLHLPAGFLPQSHSYWLHDT